MVLVIAGERSGAGKTTVTLALLATLCRRGHLVQSYKVGPDYIDPMFHQSVTDRPCANLDPVLTSEDYVRTCFATHQQGANMALVEGVMGLFDGASGSEETASTAHIARLLDLPILLVLDCARLSRSIAAIAHGYRSFDPRLKVAGVVLNRVGSDRHLELLKEALTAIDMPILGVLRRQDEITIPDRHLGLIPTAELPELEKLFDRLAHLGETCFDWPALQPLLATRRDTLSAEYKQEDEGADKPPHTRIAIARDRAFSFYYGDNLELLQKLGTELVAWSPLNDGQLPEEIDGLYLGGGFPEVFASHLAANVAARDAVRQAAETGLPIYAECGGLMYLGDRLVDFAGREFEMAGVLPTTAVMQKRLTLGYRQGVALQDSPLVTRGMRVWGHEFHRSHLLKSPDAPLFQLRGYSSRSTSYTEGWFGDRLHASYLHLHWGATPEIPARLVRYCSHYRQERERYSRRA
ncbi:MAG: cobyrinate a,c-diamide synthase [Cyanobacteriota bacterium]|nr:cobyrinate a,c-diamide synthase [Cyanobacteriota bacterium]